MGHAHSTYGQKSLKLDPPPLCTQSYAFGFAPLYAYVLSIYAPIPPPNKFLFRFKFSSLTTSRLFSFLLVSDVKFHQTNIKKISMISIYSLMPVYTFLYTRINGNVKASFVQKENLFEFLWSKKNFLCVGTQP